MILNRFYDQLIPGLNYTHLHKKEAFFTGFVSLDKTRHFLYNVEKKVGVMEGFGEQEFF